MGALEWQQSDVYSDRTILPGLSIRFLGGEGVTVDTSAQGWEYRVTRSPWDWAEWVTPCSAVLSHFSCCLSAASLKKTPTRVVSQEKLVGLLCLYFCVSLSSWKILLMTDLHHRMDYLFLLVAHCWPAMLWSSDSWRLLYSITKHSYSISAVQEVRG